MIKKKGTGCETHYIQCRKLLNPGQGKLYVVQISSIKYHRILQYFTKTKIKKRLFTNAPGEEKKVNIKTPRLLTLFVSISFIYLIKEELFYLTYHIL